MASSAAIILDDPALDEPAAEPTPLQTLVGIVQTDGDLTGLFDAQTLTKLGADVKRDYEIDLADREEWEKTARRALDRASQEPRTPGNYPFPGRSSNISYPILTVAAQQFWARAYPAICKSGSMVKVKVIGSDKGRPQTVQTPQGLVPVMAGPDGQPVPPGTPGAKPMWATPPGAKQKRADRVADYLNVYVEFRMDGWETDTSLILMQLPVIGCAFRKIWWEAGKVCSGYVSALDLVVPIATRSLKDVPRLTERMPNEYPYQITRKMASGFYRSVVLSPMSDDEQAPRVLLEQHRLVDLDGDGLEEPYVVTVDFETSQVLRIEANFDADDVEVDDRGVVKIAAGNRFYIKYGFLPHPKGWFYDIGFGHLLEQMSDVINTAINQLSDAAHAQIAGGGFIASGLRLQGNGQSNVLRFQPGEYKTVNVSGATLREAIYERTFPQPSPITFQLLDLLLAAAKDITAVKDVITGEASNNGQVGTTLALIEQALATFSAIYKVIYLALGEEFSQVKSNLSRYGGEEAAEDYANVLDDPEADFERDFGERDMDIKPVADPSSVTKMQQMARAQFLDAQRGKGLNDAEINRRVLEAAGIDDIDQLLPPTDAPPDPMAMAELAKTESETAKNTAAAELDKARTAQIGAAVGKIMGEADAIEGDAGAVPAMAGTPGDGLVPPGADGAGEGLSGPMDAGVLAGGDGRPAAPERVAIAG